MWTNTRAMPAIATRVSRKRSQARSSRSSTIPARRLLSSGFIPEAWRDVDGLTQAVRQASRADIASVIDYAIPHGDTNLRQQIQMRLNTLGINADLPNVMITSGASQALDLVVRYMLKPGDTVFVEDPGYYNLFGLLKLQGVRLVGVPRLANGPDVEMAEALLKQHTPKLFFMNTVFQNPTATNIAPQVAFRLLQLATQHGFTIVEDDIYADFQTVPTQRLASLDQFDRVIYVGGLSKTLSSSLRIGYLAANRELVKNLVDVKVLTSLGGTRFAESVAASLLERGTYRKYLERLRKRVRDSLSSAVQQLESYGWDVFDQPSGGNFVWAKVPGIEDSTKLVSEALKFGVTLAPGNYYRPNGEACAWVRINSAYAGDRRAARFFRTHDADGQGLTLEELLERVGGVLVLGQAFVETGRAFIDAMLGMFVTDKARDLFHLRDPSIRLGRHARHAIRKPFGELGLTRR